MTASMMVFAQLVMKIIFLKTMYVVAHWKKVIHWSILADVDLLYHQIALIQIALAALLTLIVINVPLVTIWFIKELKMVLKLMHVYKNVLLAFIYLEEFAILAQLIVFLVSHTKCADNALRVMFLLSSIWNLVNQSLLTNILKWFNVSSSAETVL